MEYERERKEKKEARSKTHGDDNHARRVRDRVARDDAERLRAGDGVDRARRRASARVRDGKRDMRYEV
jgi:hypothetical protein